MDNYKCFAHIQKIFKRGLRSEAYEVLHNKDI